MKLSMVAAVLLSGILTAMGMGGGGILILYLNLFTDFSQHEAQGINLLLFLPCALIAILYYRCKKVFRLKEAVPFMLWGLLGAGAGCALSALIDTEWLRKGFGVFLLVIGLRELIAALKKSKQEDQAP